jgi:cytochrome c oxidase cbb3-type subunit 3
MAVEERDPYTGHMTTGHEWNGIKELNTRVPRAVYFFLAVTATFSVIYWLLMPAWPLGWSYTKGLLGIDQREAVTEALQQAAAARAPWTKRIETQSFAEIEADPDLMRDVRETGHRLFGDNCAACHGVNAQGRKGFPNLTGPSWLWGGDPETIAETVRVGINSANKDTRVSQMPAFGRDHILERKDIMNVVAYVRSLSDSTLVTKANTPEIAAGREVFVANCAACHGEDAKGIHTGAPDLTDRFWIYGGDEQSVFNSVWNGHQGQMPTWEKRLSPVERKILALYLVDLRSHEQ